MRALVGAELAEAMAISVKQTRGAAVEGIRARAIESLAGGDDAKFTVSAVRRPAQSLRFAFLRFAPLFPLPPGPPGFFASVRPSPPPPGTRRALRRAPAVPPVDLIVGGRPNCERVHQQPASTSNARSAHPGVAPGHFRRRRFARTRQPRSVPVASFGTPIVRGPDRRVPPRPDRFKLSLKSPR